MFKFLGNLVARGWWLIFAVWIALIVISQLKAPNWNDIAEDKEFGFLPESVPSRVAEEMFSKAFPEDQARSNIAIVLVDPSGQVERNKKFIDDMLEPKLRKIAKEEGGLVGEAGNNEPLFSTEPTPEPKRLLIQSIRTPNSPGVGALLVSEDRKALLVAVELTNEFLSDTNWPTIGRVESLVDSLKREGTFPEGVEVGVTGSAVLGRDHTIAMKQSAKSTEVYTVLLVVGLLILIYRAPLLALIPLMTVFLSVHISLNLLSIMSESHIITLFQGLQVYITVLVYGAGVDYCLFLMARYKEELDHGATTAEAISTAVSRVGAALVASAGTVMCGIGMMYFAQFGKFKQAGIAIPFTLLIALCMTLTFSAAIVRIIGPWAFWPFHAPQREQPEPHSPARSFWRRFFHPGEFYRGWEAVGSYVVRKPGTIWLICVGAMLPFAAIGGAFAGKLDYNFIGNLPQDTPSVIGVHMLEQHFPKGMMGPVNVLLVNPREDFGSEQGRKLITQLTHRLEEKKDELDIADIRSLTAPLGLTPAAQRGLSEIDVPEAERERAIRRQALDHYTTDLGERKRIGTRLDIVLSTNPFSFESMMAIDRLNEVIRAALPQDVRDTTEIYIAGSTASIRDLSTVINHDHWLIFGLVLAVVFFILMLLLRQPVVSLYMVLSVLFSYYATIGVTYLFFWAVHGSQFGGLDWKVSTFLFTILIAVGEDYNIFLMARVHEEQRRHGRLRGILCGVTRTGPIISSCGVIMAGTFGSLLSGTLSEMKQLGFALAFGVLVDTFVVRPILVPSFLVLLEKFAARHHIRMPWIVGPSWRGRAPRAATEAQRR
jgi:RND superfamily putative drug exporter